MFNIRRTLTLLSGEFQSAVSWKNALALLLGLSYTCIVTVKYLGYSAATGSPACAFEPMIIIGNMSSYNIFLFSGVLVLISDAPFLDSASKYRILRSGKKAYIASNILYIIIACFLYYIICAAASIFVIMKNAYVADVWSLPMQSLSTSDANLINDTYGIYFPFREITTLGTPLNCFLHTIVLNSLYCSFLSLVIYSVNLYAKKIWGAVTALGIHLIGIVLSDSMFGNPSLSLIIHSSFVQHHFYGNIDNYPMLSTSYTIFFLGIIAIIITCRLLGKRHLEP